MLDIINVHFKMNISRQSDTDEEDVVGRESRRNVSASPVMPKLYPALEPRSADKLNAR